MVLLPALMLGFIAALVIPLAVTHSPDTFGGMLYGTVFHVPMTDAILHISWPVFGLVSVLVWGLLKVARG